MEAATQRREQGDGEMKARGIRKQGNRGDEAQMGIDMKTRNEVKYKRQIVTDEPNTYAEVTLEFEGLSDNHNAELRDLFNEFYEIVENIVKEETSQTERP